MATNGSEIPRGNLAGFTRYLKYDLKSGFLVFLIALPLCLGISLASGFPPIAGVFTAIIGAFIAPMISNSELTIKGPAAGLIVIVIGCVAEYGGNGMSDGVWSDADKFAYQAALAIAVCAAVIQILFGLFRGGILGEFFPISAVHGMLAAIGVIIILKQFPVALGVTASGEPLELLKEIPHFVAEANPAIATIGGVSLAIMFLWPVIGKRVAWLKPIPSPLIVLLVAVPLGMLFDLLHEHSYTLQGHQYQLGEQYLVRMPGRVFGMFDEMTLPNFGVLSEWKAWKWVGMFFIIGSLESVLSAKAVDIIDPWKRKTNMNRDIVGVGVGNLFAAMIGGLPMISEIVRSKANIDNGARTRFANVWHGVFLLVCVAFLPTILHRIPLAALAAMLVYTGFRLAHPTEFIHVYRIGREQLVIFVTTLVAVLATDLLIGIGIGIGVKILIHMMNGVPLNSLFKTYLDIEEQGNNQVLIRAHQSAVFSNWIPFKRQLEDLGQVQRQNIILDLSDTNLVDHSVMEKLHEMTQDFEQEGLELKIIGLDLHQRVADHDLAARRGELTRMRRMTVIGEQALEQQLIDILLSSGATGYTSTPCRGGSRRSMENGAPKVRESQVRIEIIAPHHTMQQIVFQINQDLTAEQRVTVCLEPVDVIRKDTFDLSDEGQTEKDAVLSS